MHEVITISADFGGCSFYRMKAPNMLFKQPELVIVDSMKPILQPEFYQTVRLVRVQRFMTPSQCTFVRNFLKPLSERYGFWIAYDIDDCIGLDDVPRYNRAYQAYQNPELQKAIRETMHACDFVTVSTPLLKKYVEDTFYVEPDNVCTIPNYLPRWWIDGLYHTELIEKRFDSLVRRKPRICFPLAAGHFDTEHATGGLDDITHIISWIKSTMMRYDFIFIGGAPIQLQQEVLAGYIRVVPGLPLLSYPKDLVNMQNDLFIAPLMDNIFNRCKSPIKVLESAAIGVPCLCQKLPCYTDYTSLVWDSPGALDALVQNLLQDKVRYMQSVEALRKVVDAGFWLEDHVADWLKLYNIPQKTISIELASRGREFSVKRPAVQPAISKDVTSC